MDGTYVFLGPTLTQAAASAELDAVYLPPVTAGDVYRLWRRHPRVIGIVDGRVPAVWHKEIMWVMERGVHVFGSAGVGALRAAELDGFGMRGVGWVYRAFREGTLNRDDEVAVDCDAAEDGYRPLTEAMADIRTTLLAAERGDVISAATRDILTSAGTALFYRDRTWPGLIRAGRAAGAAAAELDALRGWLPAGRVAQQAGDAVAMLREIRAFLATDPAPRQVKWTTSATAIFEAAKNRAGTMESHETVRRGSTARGAHGMTGTVAVEALAGELTEILLHSDPFGASLMGIDGYEDAVPDLSAEARQSRRDRLVSVIVRCGQGKAESGRPGDDHVLLDAVRDTAERELAAADSRADEFSVTTFPLGGPSLMLLIASQTRITDPPGATAYLARCERIPAYLDQYTDMVRDAARDGLLPVAPLVHTAVRQLRDYLAHPGNDPMLIHPAPPGWARGTAWRDDLERVIQDLVWPAVGRHLDLLTSLLPRSRPPERAGLLHVPGGVAAYACCVRNGTTLPLDPDTLYRTGLAALGEIEEEIADLGRRTLGTRDVADVMTRLRAEASLTATAGADPMKRAAAAIARAADALPDMFHAPLPPVCAVEPMPAHMAEFGAPPYYWPPARDGSRPGAYLFNNAQPGQAGSWALEVTAFHEGVPGHHVQFSRMQLLARLPLLLTAFYVVPHGEGWGLYAEQLADEFGLYSDDTQRLGMLSCAAWRAVRLVVDTGLHSRGWSRARAREFALAHSPMPADFVDAEIDRYIALPGQALGYLVGKQEILRLRDKARSQLGADYDIRDFHAAILDHGSLPLTVVGQVVDEWVDSRKRKEHSRQGDSGRE